MMAKANNLQTYYHKVYQQIDRFLQAERKASHNNLDWIRLNSYWKAGKLLEAEFQKIERQDFLQLRKHLSEKLDLETRQLYRLQQFYCFWPDSPPAKNASEALPWSKYVELLTVEHSPARNFYLKETLESDWSCKQLRKAIRQELYQNPKSLRRYKKGELKRQHSLINTFWAQVLRVIDGDTLQVRIDLRFGASLTQELRLRGINCPELKDPNGLGDKAKAFTEGELLKLQGLAPLPTEANKVPAENLPPHREPPWVLIVTYKTDKFGRYVADVYSSSIYETEAELLEKGDFLNQKLLNAGLARRVEY